MQGFTSVSEALTPEELTALLNDYLSAMTDIIQDEGGTIDKYEGDAIIAFWNAPLDLPDHAVRAVRSASQGFQDLIRPAASRTRMPKSLASMRVRKKGSAVGGMSISACYFLALFVLQPILASNVFTSVSPMRSIR